MVKEGRIHMKLYVKASNNLADLYSDCKYIVDCGRDEHWYQDYFDSPRDAIVCWFQSQENSPEDVAIYTNSKRDAIKLLKVANDEEFIYTYSEQYYSPYDPEELLDEIRTNLEDGASSTIAGPFGSQVCPFCYD